MADISKQVWKFQEGLVVVFLEKLGIPASYIHWGAKPTGLSVDTDILVGRTKSDVNLAILVTHNSADSAGLMKFWRSINELLELRTAFPQLIAANLHFESGMPPVTDVAMREFFDTSLSLGDYDLCSGLVAAAHDVTEQHLLGLQRDPTLDFIRTWVKANQKEHSGCFSKLSKWLKQSISAKPVARSWNSILLPCASTYIGQVGTHSGYRRGYAKLSLLSDEDVHLIELGKDGNLIKGSSSNLEALEVVAAVAGGMRVSDQDVIQVIRTVPERYTNAVRSLASKNMAVLPRLREQLSAISLLPLYAGWLCGEWTSITSPKNLSELLDQCFIDPASVGPKVDQPVSWHWLLDLLIYVIKQTRGSRHAFSLSKLSQEVGASGVIGRSNRLQFSYYIERKRNLSPVSRNALASTLARLLGEGTSPAAIPPIVSELLAMRVTGVVERMMNGQEFEPLYWLLEEACKAKMLSFRIDKAVESIVSDFHPKRPGTSKLTFIGGSDAESCVMAVHCRTAHDGATDKRKELCARGRTLRARITDGKVRPQLEGKLALVLDGDFTIKDAELLAKAGWTRIYGVSDIPQLVEDCLEIRRKNGTV